MNGQFQIYTGNGKGKTTAALGLALRAYGAGLKIFFAQFVKGMEYSEIKALQKLSDRIDYRIYGRDCFIQKKPEQLDIEMATKHFKEVRNILTPDCIYDMVILDELNIAAFFKLIPLDQIIELIKSRPPHVELVITGRYAPKELISLADLVTEMQEVKHYYSDKELKAREGIEF